MKAINPKNQANVNKAISWLTKYNALETRRALIGDNLGEETTEYKKADRKCINAWNKFDDYMSELPKNQQKLIYKSELY